MKYVLIKLLILFFGIALTACSSLTQMNYSQTETAEVNPMAGTHVDKNGEVVNPATPTATGGPLAGNVGAAMDHLDKVKLTRALDKPLGKATSWANGNTGVRYEITPTNKIKINGNSLCRQYQLLATRGSNTQQFNGTACVGADGNWQEVRKN